ncbi:MAG: tryptophanase [candidate division WOR-3 bacterium]|nr:MAG: tryptophanase [candidate division WOR-3 bacterium]
MKITALINKLPQEGQLASLPRPYFNHSVELKKAFSSKDRAEVLARVGLNVFFFPSEMITGCDLLSDSGVTTMTNEQWASLHMGDEAYGSNRGYFAIKDQIKKTFGDVFFNEPGTGEPNAFIFHQGRTSEDALFTQIGKIGKNLIVPSNGHFDTTGANIEANQMQALNLFADELTEGEKGFHFKGNMNIERLRTLLEKAHDRVPLVYMTITNNTAGGQPVSMENIVEASSLAHEYGIPFFFDACRFAENAWFIQQHEDGFGDMDIKDIVLKMFSCVDGFTMSYKKDGLANMGGGLFLRADGLFMKKYQNIPGVLLDYQILKEGHPTYGGLSGRDIMALASGLATVTDQEYLTYRINQVRDFGEGMHARGIPVVMPIGGHAVYVDVNSFFQNTKMKPDDFGGVALCAVLLAAYGHRACELGYFTFGHFDKVKKVEILPEVNFVRFAVPRLRYEKQDLDAVAEAMKILHAHREEIPGVRVTYGRELSLRHFKAKFEFKS